MKKKIVSILAVCMTVLAISACGNNSESDVPNEQEATKQETISEALKTHKIWYVTREPAKDSRVWYVDYYDDGKVTRYYVLDAKVEMGDFTGLSDEEVLKKVKTMDDSPETDSYILSLKTDDTGNTPILVRIEGQDTGTIFHESTPSRSYTIYQDTYQGLTQGTGVADDQYITKIKEDEPMFILDGVDTEGIEVD